MQKSIYNHQKSFVYLWYDRLFKKYYLGYHNGKRSTYICSSKPMMEQYRQRPQDFKRRIIKKGPVEEMSMLERKLLQNRKHHFGNRYYNLMIPSDSGFKTIIWTDEMRKARSILYKGRVVSEETKRKMSKGTRKRIANMTDEQKKQISDRIKANWNGGCPKGTKFNRPKNFNRKLYDHQRRIRLKRLKASFCS